MGASQPTVKCLGKYWRAAKNMKSLFLGDLEGELRDFVFFDMTIKRQKDDLDSKREKEEK